MKAKKSLGQHFLKSDKALKSIINAAEVSAEDIILEIGPGHGDLTQRLLILAGKVVAVEKDDELYELLKDKFAKEIETGRLDLVHGDILDFDPSLLKFYHDFTYKLVANIPYNITGAILRKFLSADFQPESMVLLVQKEVAERIAREKKESILSISIKAYGKPRYVETVKAGSFAPAPKVDSAIISIENTSKEFFKDFSEEEFFKMLNAGFKSKRKKLSSNLSGIYPKENVLNTFKRLGLSENIRAEEVSIDVWSKLAKLTKLPPGN
jgi:16S rRNA (adenine1518-N6/adenine1519-N6)-dimethyltransferase